MTIKKPKRAAQPKQLYINIVWRKKGEPYNKGDVAFYVNNYSSISSARTAAEASKRSYLDACKTMTKWKADYGNYYAGKLAADAWVLVPTDSPPVNELGEISL